MLGASPLMAFAATTRPDQARTFYEDVLGLRFVADEPFALVFDAHGTMLRLSKVDSFQPAPFTVLGWLVSDIRATARGLVERGVVLERYTYFEQDPDGLWTAPNGAQVAWFKDPDGNTLSLATGVDRP